MPFLLNWVPSRSRTWPILECLETAFVKIILQEHGYRITPSVLLGPGIKTLNRARDLNAGGRLGEICIRFLVLSHRTNIPYSFNVLSTATDKKAHVSPR